MITKLLTLNEARNVTLTAYLLEPEKDIFLDRSRPAVLIIPGGAYRYCSDREADPVAMVYLKAGFHAFILRYSVMEHAVWPNPLEDFEQAMVQIRENAAEWAVCPDKIAVVGFSAGGHLAACAATMAKNRPNAAILGYAATLPGLSSISPGAPAPVDFVDRRTCPCFLFSSRTDNVVPVNNSLEFMNALYRYGITFESHIYGYGPHGFSTCEPSIQNQDGLCARTQAWCADSVGWLKDLFGDFSGAEMTPPRMSAKLPGDWAETLSADCTIGHLMEHPACAGLFSQLHPEEFEKQGFPLAALKTLTLRQALGALSTPKEKVAVIDASLRQIPNT